MKKPKFYIVYGLGKSTPSKVHEEEEDAQEEAMRLACLEMGTVFVVMEAKPVEGYVVRKPERIPDFYLDKEYEREVERTAEIEQADDDSVL